MSVSAVASLQPLNGQCLRHATTGLLSIHLRAGAESVRMCAVIPLRPLHVQRRFNSNSSSVPDKELQHKRNQLPQKQQSAPPPITFRKFAGRALGAGLRSLATAVSPTGIRTAFKQSPGATALALAVLVILGVMIAYTVNLYFTYFYHSQFTRYPKPIANSLRRALYYTNISPDAELALKYYKRAMDQCAEFGLDPFSDEVLGIRIQTTFWLQKIGNYKGAAQVLEVVLADCKKWLAVMDQSVRDGKVDDEGRLRAADKPATLVAPKDTNTNKDESKEEDDEPEFESLWHKRRRLLAKCVGTSVKLGELYADEHVLEPETAQKHLLWAVETALNEYRRRQTEGVKPGEGDWLSPEEMGGAMESLGRDYESKSEFHLAIPLFFQALRLCDSPCHRAVIMNNLSASFAQNPILTSPVAAVEGSAAEPSAVIKGLNNPGMPTTRNEALEAALNWAKNAYLHAKDVKGDDRTDECDEACAVALCNWGDVAAMLGKADLARKKYMQCLDMAAKLDFPEAAKQARSGLANLAKA